MADTTRVTLEETFNDYEKTPVPEQARQTWFQQGMVWLGSGFGLSGLATGGVLADGLSFQDLLLVCILGSVIITIIGALNALVSTHTHLSTSFTCRRSFGVQGSKIIGIILCFSSFGWYAYQADMFGTTVAAVLNETSGIQVNHIIFTILGGLAMSLTAIMGFKAIKMLSEVGLPLLFILCILAVGETFQTMSPAQIWEAGPVGTPITVPMGISLVVGSFAVGITMVGDFSRFSKSKKDCVIGVSLGHFWGYIPIMLFGAVFNYAFQNWNMVEVMIAALGMGLFGAVVLVIGQWTTNDNNLYSSVLGLMNTLDGVSRIPRMRLTFIAGFISTAIAALGVYTYFVNFLSLLGVFIAPIGGILISDFYICNRNSYDEGDETIYKGFKWDAILAWVVASLAGLSMTARPIGFGWFVAVGDVFPVSLICVAIAMVIYIVSQKLRRTGAAAS